EHYPRSNPAPEGWLRWDGLKILPGAQVDFPTQPGPSRYYAARATDAAPIQLDHVESVTEPTDTTLLKPTMNRVFGLPNAREVQTTTSEHEKFIFYRGAGNFTMPLTVTAQIGGTIALKNTGHGTFRGAVLVQIQNGKVRFREIGTLDVGADVT